MSAAAHATGPPPTPSLPRFQHTRSMIHPVSTSSVSTSPWSAHAVREIDGISYRCDELGIIHQLNPESFLYDREYITLRYDSYPAERLSAMAHLRLGLLMAHIGNDHRAQPGLLDWGYGNGAFLKAAVGFPGWSAHGFEINSYGVPAKCYEAPSPYEIAWDAVTMFDVLEHLPDPFELARLQTRWLMVTVPYCHARERGLNWFADWKHRRVHEHLTNWDAPAMTEFFSSLGYDCVYVGSPEDTIRKSDNPLANTLTVIGRQRT